MAGVVVEVGAGFSGVVTGAGVGPPRLGEAGSGGKSSGGTARGGSDEGGGVEGVVGATGGVGKGGKSTGGNAGAGAVEVLGEAGMAGAAGADPPNLVMVSSASFIRRSVAFWKISSSLVIVGKTLGRSGSDVLLTMSMRLILIGSRKGESINKLMSDCLFNWSGITYTVHVKLDSCQLDFSTRKF